MSTIWEMAATIRAEEEQALLREPRAEPRPPQVQLEAADDRAYWCRYFGTTPMNLSCAIARVGAEPGALRRFFESRLRPRVRAGQNGR